MAERWLMQVGCCRLNKNVASREAVEFFFSQSEEVMMTRILAGWLAGVMVVGQVAAQTRVTLDFTTPVQRVVADLGDVDVSTVTARVVTGDGFPTPNSDYRGAGGRVASGSTPVFYKIWKGDLNAIAVGKPVVIVYQKPVRVNSGYELRDIKVATDFTLAKHAKSIQLECLTWYQLPSGARKKLTILLLNREHSLLSKRLANAEAAQDALPGLRSDLNKLKSGSVSRSTADNPRAGRSGMAAMGMAKQVAKAESLASEIGPLKEAIAILPSMNEFCEQLNERADFVVEFWGTKNGTPCRLSVKTEG